MIIDVLTLFPEMFDGILSTSILGRALQAKRLSVRLVNFRDFSTNKHRMVDDYPYGGGTGMVLAPDPIVRAVEDVVAKTPGVRRRVVLLSPQGRRLTQDIVEELAGLDHLVLICGHYEGFDERVRTLVVNDEISLGDYILTGGEIPAMAIIDAVARLLPGVLGNEESARRESFSDGWLEYPQYTRPPVYRGLSVPEVLLSGHHGEIARWRRREAIRRTLLRRPDLVNWSALTPEERKEVEAIAREENLPLPQQIAEGGAPPADPEGEN
ncbi:MULTISPECIES: tRNA (guanosine(37)-N1)-methyltransferase TrmD [Kyrpidia]|uniref:tRNA(M1G37)methyltransferase n=1 Tax=Kyrpidia spormannii TaxID=2055160 RepID=A0ACA8Z991_9BACL|nr:MULTISPECIES: tRNA (guanosine(37)-N1)-methyltransferase TrmD [Kyrpidia]MCL6575971.1 tRNA (guanosine(37)-N1)-methyltransferase TrmD [Kyrpidia sp.]CAB3392622.1 tRNA(m1G37)methyltransferase [Kyrpidia spormannii]HHY66086.1 tRNA (guanosine(37)-N1)-methyltransferase TrmD [Alicyclobacillus sp.]